jgi:hypothetical protein
MSLYDCASCPSVMVIIADGVIDAKGVAELWGGYYIGLSRVTHQLELEWPTRCPPTQTMADTTSAKSKGVRHI